MDAILQEIERALAGQAYYAALMTTLSLPDICAALERPDGKTEKQYYKAWCDTWLTGYPDVSSDDLYSLRCGVMHQGRLGHPSSQYSRIMFSLPNRGVMAHHNILGDALNLDLATFCHDMMNAVSRWYDAKQNDPNVKANIQRLVQYRANGLAPYIGGVPAIW